ncbi:class I SAM-dependent methyltransferase [Micromonospora sp. NPDC049366]|uniref:class I SAM-dependent methyltransferase n=1 Tax=Micromonospora sp. NPDC049366 TaxID=3364271 RepID=UPI00378DCFEB
MHQLTAKTREILASAVINGTEVTVTGEQHSREDWVPVATAFQALGGVYTKRIKGYTFETDPTEAIKRAVKTGRAVPVSQSEGYVPTPGDVAEEVCSYPYTDLERLPAGSVVLEPSAGGGQLVRAILEVNPGVRVVALEPNKARAALIGDHDGRVTVFNCTLEEYAATARHPIGAGSGIRFNAVVMNPPFAVPGNATLWIDHVMLAWELLRPGGRLVAIVPSALKYRHGKKFDAIRALMQQCGGSEALRPDAFPSVQARALHLGKPIPMRDERPSYLVRYYDAVEPVRVEDPILTAQGAIGAPVQVWYDSWRRRDRVLRWRGQCHGCQLLVWGFDDGENDPRGVLGNHSAGWSLEPTEYQAAGPAVALCAMCGNTYESYKAALDAAEVIWAEAAEERARRAARPDPWGPLLRQLELDLAGLA